jgi:hypothetical protein
MQQTFGSVGAEYRNFHCIVFYFNIAMLINLVTVYFDLCNHKYCNFKLTSLF